jgi:hypothetical protein
LLAEEIAVHIVVPDGPPHLSGRPLTVKLDDDADIVSTSAGDPPVFARDICFRCELYLVFERGDLPEAQRCIERDLDYW